MIPFTDRELQRAWRDNKSAYQVTNCTNAHRLLLFYAVECGLKAVIMKQRKVNRTNLCPAIGEAQHNINRLLDFLNTVQSLKLPEQLQMTPIRDNRNRNNPEERKVQIGQINQMWRYGGCSAVKEMNDNDLEQKLWKISQWIEQELGRL